MSTYKSTDVELKGRVVVGASLVEVDEEEDVGPLVVFLPHVMLKALTQMCI